MFGYMLHNLDAMFDGDTIVKHFDIFDGSWQIDSDEIKELVGAEIPKDLLPWIKKEAEEARLLNHMNWKPFRDPSCLTSMYLGYKKMYHYKQYYFQLSLLSLCGECEYCAKGESRIHFELAYYGYKEEYEVNLHPYNHYVVLPDMMMTENYWKSH